MDKKLLKKLEELENKKRDKIKRVGRFTKEAEMPGTLGAGFLKGVAKINEEDAIDIGKKKKRLRQESEDKAHFKKLMKMFNKQDGLE